MANSEKLKKLIEEVREESSVAVQFSEKLTKEFSEDLDNAIRELEVIMDSIGESSIEDIPDTQLEYYCVKIPALMYRAGVKLEEFGLMADISSSQKRQEYNEAMLKVSGTVQEKKARVEQLIEDKALVEVIYKRTYNSLRGKLDMAEKLYSGLKKALSKRISESDLDRFSKDGVCKGVGSLRAPGKVEVMLSPDLAQVYKMNDKKRVYIRTDRNGTKYFADYTCKRCGGQGGLPQWIYTGYTCYECGGTGVAAKPEIF